jgi:hypothetical protein
MRWTSLKKWLTNGSDDAAVISRRDILAGIGVGGLFLVAGSTLLASSTAEARVDTRVTEPETAPDDVGAKDGEHSTADNGGMDVDRADATELSSQWRRRYYGYGYGPRRRYWRRRRRRYWRRRYYWGRSYYRRPYWRRRYYY